MWAIKFNIQSYFFFLAICATSFASSPDLESKESFDSEHLSKIAKSCNMQVITIISVKTGQEEIASGIPLAMADNPDRVKYVITAAHCSMVHATSGTELAFTADPTKIFLSDKGIALSTMLKDQGNQKLYSAISNKQSLSSLSQASTNKVDSLKKENKEAIEHLLQFSKSSEAWKKLPEGHLSTTSISVGGKEGLWNINTGRDIALLTLKTPLNLAKGKVAAILPSKEMDLTDLCRYPAFIVGRSLEPMEKGRIHSWTCIPLPSKVSYDKKANIFYYPRITLGGKDDNFIAPTMSGGGLFFYINSNFVYGGVVGQTNSHQMLHNMLSASDETLKDFSAKKIEQLKKKELPVYEIFAALSDNIITDLHKFMLLNEINESLGQILLKNINELIVEYAS